MAEFVILILVALAAVVVFVLYRRGMLPSVGAPKKPEGRLHQRAQGGERDEPRARRDDFVDAQAAVWDSGAQADEEPPALFADDLDDGEPVDEEPAYEEPAYEEPAYEEPAYEEPAYEEPAYEEPAYEDAVYAEADDAEPLDVADDEPVADRFAARSAPPARSRVEAEPEPEPEPEVLVTSDGSTTLAKRTPKSESESKRQPARLTQASQRPTGVARRSPDQVRSMLTSYRGGLKKARTDDERPE